MALPPPLPRCLCWGTRATVFLHFSDLFDLGACPSSDPQDMLAYVRGMTESDWTEDIILFHSELHIIRTLLSEGEPMQSVAAVSTMDSTEDVGLRSDVLEHMAASVKAKFGQENSASQEGHEREEKQEPGSDSAPPARAPRQLKFPRVDPPEVEDDPGQGIPENTPGPLHAVMREFPPADIFTAQTLRTADPQMSCVCAQCAHLPRDPKTCPPHHMSP